VEVSGKIIGVFEIRPNFECANNKSTFNAFDFARKIGTPAPLGAFPGCQPGQSLPNLVPETVQETRHGMEPEAA
jgi:hypothetical protein